MTEVFILPFPKLIFHEFFLKVYSHFLGITLLLLSCYLYWSNSPFCVDFVLLLALTAYMWYSKILCIPLPSHTLTHEIRQKWHLDKDNRIRSLRFHVYVVFQIFTIILMIAVNLKEVKKNVHILLNIMPKPIFSHELKYKLYE